MKYNNKKLLQGSFWKPVQRNPSRRLIMFEPVRVNELSNKHITPRMIKPSGNPFYIKPAEVRVPVKHIPNKIGIVNDNIKVPRKQMNWIQAKAKYKNLNPFNDDDGDGLMNYLDCKPFNPKQQEPLSFYTREGKGYKKGGQKKIQDLVKKYETENKEYYKSKARAKNLREKGVIDEMSKVQFNDPGLESERVEIKTRGGVINVARKDIYGPSNENPKESGRLLKERTLKYNAPSKVPKRERGNKLSKEEMKNILARNKLSKREKRLQKNIGFKQSELEIAKEIKKKDKLKEDIVKKLIKKGVDYSEAQRYAQRYVNEKMNTEPFGTSSTPTTPTTKAVDTNLNFGNKVDTKNTMTIKPFKLNKNGFFTTTKVLTKKQNEKLLKAVESGDGVKVYDKVKVYDSTTIGGRRVDNKSRQDFERIIKQRLLSSNPKFKPDVVAAAVKRVYDTVEPRKVKVGGKVVSYVTNEDFENALINYEYRVLEKYKDRTEPTIMPQATYDQLKAERNRLIQIRSNINSSGTRASQSFRQDSASMLNQPIQNIVNLMNKKKVEEKIARQNEMSRDIFEGLGQSEKYVPYGIVMEDNKSEDEVITLSDVGKQLGIKFIGGLKSGSINVKEKRIPQMIESKNYLKEKIKSGSGYIGEKLKSTSSKAQDKMINIQDRYLNDKEEAIKNKSANKFVFGTGYIREGKSNSIPKEYKGLIEVPKEKGLIARGVEKFKEKFKREEESLPIKDYSDKEMMKEISKRESMSNKELSSIKEQRQKEDDREERRTAKERKIIDRLGNIKEKEARIEFENIARENKKRDREERRIERLESKESAAQDLIEDVSINADKYLTTSDKEELGPDMPSPK